LETSAKILASKGKLLSEIYFELQQYFEKKYGSNTLVLIEIGTFFEVYEVNNNEALAILIEFIIEHDEAIIEKMNRPIFLGESRYLYLGNNALEQLGVISRDKSEVTLLTRVVNH